VVSSRRRRRVFCLLQFSLTRDSIHKAEGGAFSIFWVRNQQGGQTLAGLGTKSHFFINLQPKGSVLYLWAVPKKFV
jgi:hypothetical protein